MALRKNKNVSLYKMSEPEPEIEAPEIVVEEETLRQRLDRARGGSRLAQYEEILARRRRTT